LCSELVDPLSPNSKVFAITPELTLELQTEAYNWAKGNVSVKQRAKSGRTSFYISPTGESNVRDCDILWKVVMEGDDWSKSTCTCKNYWKC
jgi:hypothetical protein